MSLARNFEEYKQEIELSCIQNRGVEIELYSIIACIIRESDQGKEISVRDVSNRRNSGSHPFIKNYKSDSGFPDFIILERKKDSNVRILGCIEAKMPSVFLNLDNDQIKDYLNYFNKVIYTNGIEWMYFENKDKVFDVSLGEMIDKNSLKIKWGQEKTWNNLLKRIDEIEWTK